VLPRKHAATTTDRRRGMCVYNDPWNMAPNETLATCAGRRGLCSLKPQLTPHTTVCDHATAHAGRHSCESHEQQNASIRVQQNNLRDRHTVS
jgi:hypothetical protein